MCLWPAESGPRVQALHQDAPPSGVSEEADFPKFRIETMNQNFKMGDHRLEQFPKHTSNEISCMITNTGLIKGLILKTLPYSTSTFRHEHTSEFMHWHKVCVSVK